MITGPEPAARCGWSHRKYDRASPPLRAPDQGGRPPRQKPLQDFDFAPNPTHRPGRHPLACCEWTKKGEPLCPIGDSGTGKSNLLIALGTAAAVVGFRVRYVFGGNIIATGTDSYRLAHAKNQQGKGRSSAAR